MKKSFSLILVLVFTFGLVLCSSASCTSEDSGGLAGSKGTVTFESSIATEIDGELTGEWKDATKFGKMVCGTTYRLKYKCVLSKDCDPLKIVATFDRANAEPVLGVNTIKPEIERIENVTIATFEVTKSYDVEFKITPYRAGEDITYEIDAKSIKTPNGQAAVKGYLSVPLVFAKGKLATPIIRNVGAGQLEWDKVRYASAYEVWLRVGGSGEFSKADTITPDNDGPYVYKPSAMGDYQVYVEAISSAVNDFERSEPTEIQNVVVK